jgi:ribosomal protein S1
MVSIPKVVGLMSCGFLLCLGLSNAALATDDMKAGQPERQGGQAGLKGEQDKLKGGHMVTGEVLRIDGNDFLVERSNGKEVRLHLDANTQMTEMIGRGDQIEAKVSDMNNEKRVLSIRHMQ